MTDETATRAELLLMADDLAEHMAAFRDRLLLCESINVASWRVKIIKTFGLTRLR